MRSDWRTQLRAARSRFASKAPTAALYSQRIQSTQTTHRLCGRPRAATSETLYACQLQTSLNFNSHLSKCLSSWKSSACMHSSNYFVVGLSVKTDETDQLILIIICRYFCTFDPAPFIDELSLWTNFCLYLWSRARYTQISLLLHGVCILVPHAWVMIREVIFQYSRGMQTINQCNGFDAHNKERRILF